MDTGGGRYTYTSTASSDTADDCQYPLSGLVLSRKSMRGHKDVCTGQALSLALICQGCCLRAP